MRFIVMFIIWPMDKGFLDCKTRENSNFLKKGKMVISVKNPKFIF